MPNVFEPLEINLADLTFGDTCVNGQALFTHIGNIVSLSQV